MLKILMILVIMVFIVTSVFYTDMLAGMLEIITNINNGFIVYIPNELKILITIIIFAVMVGVASAFIS